MESKNFPVGLKTIVILCVLLAAFALFFLLPAKNSSGLKPYPDGITYYLPMLVFFIVVFLAGFAALLFFISFRSSLIKPKYLAILLKIIIAAASVTGILLAAVLIPSYLHSTAAALPSYAFRCRPWLAFELLFSLPCFAALFFGWKIAVNIGNDRSFSRENSSYLRDIAVLAAADSGFFFLGNILLYIFNMSHSGIVFFAAPAVAFLGIAASLVFIALSHMVYKAALLREDSELTI